ncbi:glycosyltransferase family 39 protein [Amedibacillus dolichus]|nr:glycosyltransferase family 39 protein [Amedibacillus dolichus]MCB5373860.1 glycosyltransferase family 39 protein [Amedibacillus dolichus]
MDKMGIDKIKKILYILFHILFSITFTGVFFIVIKHQESSTDRILMLLSTGFFMLLILFLYWFIIKSRCCFPINKKTIGILFAIFFCIQLGLGMLLMVKPSWDFGHVFDEAVALTKNNSWEISNIRYFLRYPNNQFYLLTLTCLYKLLSIFHIGNYIAAGILTNIVLTDISLVILCLAVKKLWGKKNAVFALLLSFLCPAYITYLPIFYTDTFPLPLMNTILLLYIVILKETDRKKLLGYGILLGFSVFLGFELKATVVIVLIAAILHVFFVSGIKKTAVIAVSCLAFFGSIKIYDYAFESSKMLDDSLYDTYNYPYTHWVMMGLRNPGGYNVHDYKFTKSFPTRQAKTDANIAQIKSRIAEMGFSGMLDHLGQKIHYTWGDGAFFSQKLLERKPLTQGVVREIVTEHGAYFSVYQIIVNGIQYAIILLLSISGLAGIYKIKHDGEMDFISFIRLSVFGLFVFLLIWESKSKYLVNFLPFIYFVAIDGVRFIFDKKEGIKHDTTRNRNSLLQRRSGIQGYPCTVKRTDA